MKLIVNGGKKLSGSVVVKGAKNATTKMMVASLLTKDEVRLRNFPIIGDTEITGELCQAFGSKLSIDKNKSELIIQTPEITSTQALNLTRKNRIPILAMGPLLARSKKAIVPVLGGDKIGPRPVGLHIDALRSLGAEVNIFDDRYEATAPNGLKGAKIVFPFPSVGATENVILAAVLAKGRTVIENAAIEPEILDIIKLLQKMGAIIGLGANRTIYIEGVKELHGAEHFILPDRNEVISFAILAAVTNGEIKVLGAKQDDLITFLNVFRKIGGGYQVEDDGIIFFKEKEFVGIELETDTHPGFMTDWQQPTVVLLTQAKGISVIHETIYEDRFAYTEDLNAMGADITIFSKCLGEINCRFNGKGYGHSAVIKGATPLSAKTLKVRDLRAGMAHLIAALMANGSSEIDGVEEIDRGYEDLDNRLKSLGADIIRKE